MSLPTGTVTFLFTDIEGSTRLLQQLGERYANVLTQYRRLLRYAIEEHGGQEVDTQGDAFFSAFPRARDAVTAAIAAQRALLRHPWPDDRPVRARMGLHTGEPATTDTGYVGLDVHRAARIGAAGHGGQILMSQTTRDLLEEDLPSGVTLRDMGEHRLKDLARPQRLFQAVLADLPSDFGPLKSLAMLPNNLPVRLTSFIGREREQAEIKRLLSTARFVTLTGSGGAGKTRLALQVAAEVVEEFKDGVWFVDLAPLSDPVLVPITVAGAMGLPEPVGRPPIEMLADYLRSRSALLLLDNCEHLLAACANLAEALLRVCPRLRILATSRQALGVEGEITFRVPSLSLPDGLSVPLERLTEFEAVRLFVDRAAAALPNFMMTAQNGKAVATICRRLDGIPLAIELAAARVKVLSVENIAERLHDRFKLLTSGSQTALPRHQTLRAAMDWSHDLLSEPERVLLRRLSVFAGGFMLEAAEAVCQGQSVSGDDVLDLLTRLVEKSLVVFQERDGRYHLLETVRQYGANELLASGEIPQVRRRHRDWYRALAEQADRGFQGMPQRVWLDQFEVEHDNLRAALEWSKTQADDAESALRLAGALWAFWYMRGHWTEAFGWLVGALARASDAPASAQAQGLRGAVLFSYYLNAPEQTRVMGEEFLAICRELGNKAWMSWALMLLAVTVLTQRNDERARALFEEGLALAREAGNKFLAGLVLAQWGILARLEGDLGHAATLSEESVALMREVGDEWGTAYSLRLLARVTLQQRDMERATGRLKESLVLARNVDSAWVAEQCLEGLAWVAGAQRRHEQAARLLGAAEALRRTLGFSRQFLSQPRHDDWLPSARVGLGDAAFSAAWAEGQAMTLQQAIEYALNDESGGRSVRSPFLES